MSKRILRTSGTIDHKIKSREKNKNNINSTKGGRERKRAGRGGGRKGRWRGRKGRCGGGRKAKEGAKR